MSWPLRPISELCDLAVDCVNKTAPVVDKVTPYKMIRTTNVKGGFVDIDEVRYVTKYTFEKWTRRSQPKYGDVILIREAPVGEVGRCVFDDDENVFLGQRLFQYRPNADVLDWNFLAYALQSPEVQGRLHAKAFGSTVPHVKVGYAESLLVPCPPIDEQKVIGSTLANYDDLITTNQRRIQLLEEAARRLYREWFVHLRFPGHEQVSVENGVPKRWERLPLTSLVEFNPKTTFEKGKVSPYVEMAALSNNSMVIDYVGERIIKGGAKFKNYDTLLARITPCLENGKTGFVQFLNEDEVASGSTEFIVMRSKRVNPFWVYCLARDEEFREFSVRSMSGADGRQRVNVKAFGQLDILLPEENLLVAFGELAKPMFDQINVLTNQNTQLKQARDKLLPKLMSGQLNINSLATTANKEEE